MEYCVLIIAVSYNIKNKDMSLCRGDLVTSYNADIKVKTRGLIISFHHLDAFKS